MQAGLEVVMAAHADAGDDAVDVAVAAKWEKDGASATDMPDLLLAA